MKFGLIGIPFNGDGTRPDVENPAASLRRAGISTLPIGREDTLLDYGDLDITAFEGLRDRETGVLNLEAWKETSLQAAKQLCSISKEVDFTFVLGGDCSVLLGIFGAFSLSRMRVGLVSLDGHTDYRDPFSSPSGEPADLELAILTGNGPEALTELFGKAPLIEPSDVVVCGFREPDLIAMSKIHYFNRSAFREYGSEKFAHKTLLLLGDLDRLWFHFDVDALDPAIMPVSFPEPDGLAIDETQAFISAVIGSKKFIGMSISCYHPRLDPEGRAASSIVELSGSVLPSCRKPLNSSDTLTRAAE